MKKTANIKQAVSIVAQQIEYAQKLHQLKRFSEGRNDASMADDYARRARQEVDRYYNITTAFCFLYEARFVDFERMALDSLGHENIDNAEQLWES